VLNANLRASIRTLLGRAAIASGVLAGVAQAQSLSFGQLDGTARDDAGRPVNGAEVRVKDRASGAVRWTITERDGVFRFAVLPAGRYDVTVEALGYRPVVHLGVEIAVGHSVRLDATIRVEAPPVTVIDTVRARAAAAGASTWLFDRGFGDLVGERRLASDVAALGTVADEHSVEGLPWRLTETMIDGARSAGFGAQAGTGNDAAGLAFPVRGLSAATVGGLGFDVEAGGTGVGVRATSQRGGHALATRSLLEGGTANYGGAFIIGGPLQGDTAQAIVGVEYQRSEVERPAFFGADSVAAAALADAALTTYGADLSAYTAPASRIDERLGGFGRIDWQPGDRFAMSLRASGTRFTSSGLAERYGLASAFGSDYEAIGAQASLNLYSRISRRITNEIRVSADVGESRGRSGGVPRTSFAGTGVEFGDARVEPFDDDRTTPRVSALMHFDFGAHRLKAGVAVASHRFDARYARGAAGEFAYGDLADFTSGDGAWRRTEGAAMAGEFRMSETAFFVQDAWRLVEGFSVTLGARIDGTRFPAADIRQNAEWLALSGIDNTDIEGKRSRVSPRLGLRWELGRDREWVFEGGAGVFQDLPDRRDVAEALTFDRGADVRYGAGPISSWPSAPDSFVVPVVGRTMTLLGPDFEGPRTQRLALGLTRRMGDWSAMVNGVYRHTEYLARRRDLNLPASPVGQDQYGRPLYGTLRRVGTALAAVPQSNRRFLEFDAVHALEATGVSDFYGVTAGLERVREQGLNLGISYTFSRTTDNVPGFAGSRLSPFPGGLGGVDWVDGRSDFDIPHRLLIAADWAAGPAGALRFGAVYRLRSGTPFTPGVRGGVDANGDGDWRNDPAFIDANLAGMDALLEDHECLRTRTGVFAERNACRGDLVHRLDLRASVPLADLLVGRLELMVDALDVIAPSVGPIDRALLLVDRTGSVTTNPGTGVTSVPYLVNPDFGRVLADRSPGVLWRVGLRIVP
jgi:hypothetical protein